MKHESNRCADRLIRRSARVLEVLYNFMSRLKGKLEIREDKLGDSNENLSELEGGLHDE